MVNRISKTKYTKPEIRPFVIAGKRKERSRLSNKRVATEAVVQRCFVKNIILEISQNSQENTCVGVPFLIKLQA